MSTAAPRGCHQPGRATVCRATAYCPCIKGLEDSALCSGRPVLSDPRLLARPECLPAVPPVGPWPAAPETPAAGPGPSAAATGDSRSAHHPGCGWPTGTASGSRSAAGAPGAEGSSPGCRKRRRKRHRREWSPRARAGRRWPSECLGASPTAAAQSASSSPCRQAPRPGPRALSQAGLRHFVAQAQSACSADLEFWWAKIVPYTKRE